MRIRANKICYCAKFSTENTRKTFNTNINTREVIIRAKLFCYTSKKRNYILSKPHNFLSYFLWNFKFTYLYAK